MGCYVIEVCAIPKGTCAIRGYGPKSGITDDGWVESNIRVFVDQVLTKSTVAYLAEGHRNRMTTWLYHTPNPPSYIYHKATSAYTATVQLYARSGQLATAERVEERQGDGNGGYCRLGCLEMEDERHIFSNCPYFDEWRWEAGRQLRRTLSTRLAQSKLHDRTVDIILRKAELFYTCDSDIWPLGDSQYYLGLVPKMQRLAKRRGSGFSGEGKAYPRDILRVVQYRCKVGIKDIWRTTEEGDEDLGGKKRRKRRLGVLVTTDHPPRHCVLSHRQRRSSKCKQCKQNK